VENSVRRNNQKEIKDEKNHNDINCFEYRNTGDIDGW
jgi:hypothetical protein